MLEELISNKDTEKKKRILSDEYGMIMTTELEGRINTMCNWSIAIAEREREIAREEVREEVKEEVREEVKDEIRKEERLDSIGRMIKAGVKKEQILLCGYTEEELSKAESTLLTTA